MDTKTRWGYTKNKVRQSDSQGLGVGISSGCWWVMLWVCQCQQLPGLLYPDQPSGYDVINVNFPAESGISPHILLISWYPLTINEGGWNPLYPSHVSPPPQPIFSIEWNAGCCSQLSSSVSRPCYANFFTPEICSEQLRLSCQNKERKVVVVVNVGILGLHSENAP